MINVRIRANFIIVNREIVLYEDEKGRIPVKDFLDSLDLKSVKKIAWILKIIEDKEFVPKTYFKKLVGTDGIWEVRINISSNIYRLFCFWDKDSLIILTHGIIKKTQKTPVKEIKLAERYRKDYFRRKNK